jgi:hypothetical protein
MRYFSSAWPWKHYTRVSPTEQPPLRSDSLPFWSFRQKLASCIDIRSIPLQYIMNLLKSIGWHESCGVWLCKRCSSHNKRSVGWNEALCTSGQIETDIKRAAENLFFISSSYTLVQVSRLSSYSLYLFTDCRTPWTSDWPVIRPLPKHRSTQRQKNAYIHQTSMP